MLLDAGQKGIGLIECSHCNYVYNAGDPNDEALHEDHHNATHILHFVGWKHEHVLDNLPNGDRIIVVLPNDSKVWIEKVKRVIEVIDRDMGYYDMTLNISSSKVFLYIMNKTIIGCVVAENKDKGYKILNPNTEVDLCSTEEYPLLCGVSRIWVSLHYRKKGIATKLMNVVKSHFIPGYLLDYSDIGLSSPTTAGKLFGAKYFKTPNFFTYFS
ncbi:hypothetical protein HHI36_023931 [Cryptolaemus montrouzieri]|uniref:N-acetyltransferase ESCO2 n=1 Tax=Cryptolaemus montrouzieri TaxID=559131 RepID=A0ABD2NP75_9CUCU